MSKLEADDPQTKADGLIEVRDEGVTEAQAREILPYVIEALESDNAWVQMKAPAALAALGEEHGATLGPLVADRCSTVVEQLEEIGDEHWEPVARLLGGAATEEAIEELDRWASLTGSRYQEPAERALRVAAAAAIDRLERTELESEGPVADGLLYLAREHPHLVLEHESILFELLESPNGEIASATFLRLLRTDARTALSMETLIEVAEVEQSADDARIDAAVNGLDAIVRSGYEGDAIDRLTERYHAWLDANQPAIQRRGLSLLRPIAETTPDRLEGRIEAIAELATREDSAVFDPARELLRSYAAGVADCPREYLVTLLETTDGLPGFTWLAETMDVLRYRDDETWEGIDLDRLTGSLISELHDAYQECKTVPVFWPAFDPRMTVTAAIATLLDCAPDGRDPILYTKGTPNHWGGKSEVRAEYERYGIELPEHGWDEDRDVIGLDEVLPHGYVYEGERGLKGDTPGPATLVLVSRESELEAVTGSGPVLFNFHARVTDAEEELVDSIADGAPDRSVCSMYSLYSKREHGGDRVPEYGPPDLSGAGVIPTPRAIRDALDSDPGSDDGPTPFLAADRRLRDLTAEREITIEAVDGADIREHLNEGYEAAMFLVENGSDYAGWRSFSYLQRFERLPVPADRYDSWVLDKRRRSKRGSNSWRMEEFLEEFDSFVHNVDMLARAGTSDVLEQLRYLLPALERENPLYRALCERVDAAVKERRSLAIYTPSPAWRRTLRECLIDDHVAVKGDFRPERIQIVDRDTVRELDGCDELVIAGPQRSQHAGFHLHPDASEITILTYDGRWGRMLEARTQKFIDRVNTVMQSEGSTPISHPEFSGDPPEGTPESEAADELDATGEQADETTGRGGIDTEAIELQERIAQSLDETRLTDEYAHEEDRYDDYTPRTFTIETEDGTTLERDSGSRILVVETDIEGHDVEESFRWMSPAELPDGATVAVIDDEIWDELWDEWLDEQYADIEGGRVTEQLQVWYDTVTDILAEVQAETGADDRTDPAVLNEIVVALRAAGVERGENRIHAWFESVHDASNALDLTRDPGLTIGPGSVDDIQRIGEAFDRPELTGDDGLRIDAALRKIRGAHVHEGRAIRKDIEKRLNEGGDKADRILAGSSRYQVAAVTTSEG